MPNRSKICVCSRSFSNNRYLRNYLDELPVEVNYTSSMHTLGGEDLIEFISSAHVIIVGLEVISRDVIDKCTNLKMVCKMGTGIDKIDTDGLHDRDIEFFHTPGFNVNAVAEVVIHHSLHILRKMDQNINHTNHLIWRPIAGCELSGKTFGIVGFGSIGQRLATLLSSFGCTIYYFDIDIKSDSSASSSAEFRALDFIFSSCDLVSVHLPLNERTFKIIDRKFINALKPGSIIINTSRGEVVDEQALKDRLNHGDIYAILDVLSHEPNVDWSFASMKNVLVTPHMGGSTYEAIARSGRSIVDFLKSRVDRLCCIDSE